MDERNQLTHLHYVPQPKSSNESMRLSCFPDYRYRHCGGRRHPSGDHNQCILQSFDRPAPTYHILVTDRLESLRMTWKSCSPNQVHASKDDLPQPSCRPLPLTSWSSEWDLDDRTEAFDEPVHSFHEFVPCEPGSPPPFH